MCFFTAPENSALRWHFILQIFGSMASLGVKSLNLSMYLSTFFTSCLNNVRWLKPTVHYHGYLA